MIDTTSHTPSFRRGLSARLGPSETLRRRSQASPPLRVAIVGHLKYGIARPFMGGLERFTHALVKGLERKGIDVTLFATGDSDPELPSEWILPGGTINAASRKFPNASQKEEREAWIEQTEDAAYVSLMERLSSGDLAGWFDVVHNNSINPVPLDYADRLAAPCTTTLHVPILPRLREQLECGGPRGEFVNISRANETHWGELLPNQSVIANAVDTNAWVPQPLWRSPRAVWFGRIHPDKGTQYAIEAAHKAGLPIDVIGPINDEEYFRTEVEPLLQPGRGDRLLGACDTVELQRLVARAAVCFVTPCWEEPFGLVTAEAMSCGTPVAAFRRGGPSEIVTEECGRLATPGDVEELADAARQCLTLDRRLVRQATVNRFDEEIMVDQYVAHYESLATRPMRASDSPVVPNSGMEKQIALA